MPNKVFFSWQSDTDRRYNTNFIREVIKDAIREAWKTENLEFYYDEASVREIGSYDITEALFQKIKNSTVVIADVTFINKEKIEERKVSNPNVLLELGYAAGIIGWKNVVPVFNLAYGDLQDIPFDIRNRRITAYRFEEGSDKKAAYQLLKQSMVAALKDMDVANVRKRDLINRAFASQSEVARFHALYNRDDEYWHSKLISELLGAVLYNLKNEYELVIKGIVFEDQQKMNAREFLVWFQQVAGFQRDVVEALKNIVQRRLIETLKREDPVEILELSQMIERLGNRLIQIELKRRSLVIDERLIKYRDYAGPNMSGFISFFEKLLHTFGTLHIESQDKPRITNDDLYAILNLDESRFNNLQEVIRKVAKDEK